MKKLALLGLLLTLGLNAGSLPIYHGSSNAMKLCKYEMMTEEQSWAKFNALITMPEKVEYAKTMYAGEWEQMLYHMDNGYSNHCKEALSKKEYSKWYKHVKNRANQLKKAGWTK